MTSDITINQLDPNTFEYQTYMSADENLIASSDLDTVFSSLTDYIEYYIYDQNQTLVYPFETVSLVRYDIREGDVILNPVSNLQDLGFDIGSYNILYSFYRKRLSSNISEKYFISEISSDRTEIRLDSNTIANELIISSTNDFIEYRETAEYFVDFYLNFGNNQTVIANNIKLETDENLDPTVLIKLYEPLPTNFDIKDELWVVELLSKPQAYEVNFVFEPEIEQDFTYIQGPNYSLDIINQTATSGEQFSYSTLIDSNITSSINQIQSLLNEKEVNINVDYEDYNNFVNFSSAKTRLENFYYKVGLIESYTNELNNFLSQVTSDTTFTLAYSSSKAQLTGKIDGIIKNFDGYEYFLYFNSGSQYSYPKQNTEPPFQLYSTGSTEALTWIGSANINDPYYGGQALNASNYDQDNKDWLYWSIPEYLREDSANQKYELFVDMVGQYYDNVWVYTKDISNKFDADNRLSYGISKDLVADAIKDFGVKLYSNNFNTDDLFTAFLGLTPSGSAFPFPNITGSLPVESGYEYVDTKISASDNIVPQDDINKSLYKRIYHNIPYLLKTKGTVAGLRALITSYGIPDTILRISEFGGKDRNEAQDYDLKQDVFNYAFDTGENATNYLTSLFDSNPIFPGGGSSPKSVQLRFKSAHIPLPTNNIANSNIRYSQSIFSTNDSGGNLVLEYTGSGLISGSYSGSIPDPYDTYGTLKWIPAEGDNPDLSASVYLPFFNGDWWSVQMNVNDVTASLYAANEIDGKIGFNESSSTVGFDDSYYFDASIGYLNKSTNVVFDDGTTYTPFSGSFQELRYYVNEISQSHFYDYTVNPYSNEGNGINSTPDQQFFRAALGTQLDTGSRTSIHPRVTGSVVQITSSFDGGDSSFDLNGEKWVTNVENIFQDQVPAGIKNRITNKIQTENLILAEAPYGISGSTAVISSENNDTTTISQIESIQQQSFVSQSYTPSVNYLEVGFSPTNQINDDINAQLGYFNIGDYIGDPRFISSSAKSYPDLDRLRDAYFEKYMASYDIVDFIRLIKFFDNSLFKMIKDFTPARTSLASGVVVKQHLLERNRQRPAQVESSIHDYSGSIKPFVKDYNTGSADQPQYSTSGSAIYKFSGGAGGVMNKYNGLQTSPSASAYGLTNKFGPLTQSYEETLSGPLGQEVVTIFNQDEFYNGEFSGSDILVQNGNLNPNCDIYLNPTDKPISFNPIFFSVSNILTQGITSVGSFNNINNYPKQGDAWFLSTTQDGAFDLGIQYIKLASNDINGNYIADYIESTNTLDVLFNDAVLPGGKPSTEYFINNSVNNGTHVLIEVSNTQGNYNITGSSQGGSEHSAVEISGSYTSSYNQTQAGNADLYAQNNFTNSARNNQSQIIYFWGEQDGTPSIPKQPEELQWFNPGDKNKPSDDLLNSTDFRSGSYLLERTPNVPLYFSASFSYSSSDLGVVGGITSSGNYIFSASAHPAGAIYQSFILNNSLDNGSFIPSTKNVDADPNIFTGNDRINQNLLGNQGSGNTLAGNSQILQAGTASFDFYFPSFTFTNQANTMITPTGYDTYYTGSDYSSNEDFDGTESNIANIGYVDPTKNGEVVWDWREYTGSTGGSQLGTLLGTFSYKLYIDSDDYPYDIAEAGIKFFGDALDGPSTGPGTFEELDPDSFNGLRISYEDGSGTPIVGIPNGTINSSNPYIIVEGTFQYSTYEIFQYFNDQYEVYPSMSIIPYFNTQETLNPQYWIGDFEVLIAETDQVSAGVSYPGPYTYMGYSYYNTSSYYSYQNEQNFSATDPIQPLRDGYQGDSSNTSTLTPNTNVSILTGNTITASVSLRYTSSTRDDLITQSNDLYHTFETASFAGQVVTETITFPDSPILGIRNENLGDSDNTVNEVNGMYYYQVDFKNWDRNPIIPSVDAINEIDFTNNSGNDTIIEIAQELQTIAEGDYITASLYVQQGNISNNSTFGTKYSLGNFLETSNLGLEGTTSITGSLPVSAFNEYNTEFNAGDTLRFGIDVAKSFGAGLIITEYSMSIYPSSSRWAQFSGEPSYTNFDSPDPTGVIVPSFYGNGVLPFNYALDCQPLLNNYNEQRSSTFLMDIDYNSQSGPIIPINQAQILSGSAVKATIPDSNYSQLKSIIPRYLGSKSTSQQLNVWNIGDTGTFGKLPTIELRDAFFGYFNDLDDPYPNINNLTRVNLNYLIDEQGNALPPSLEPLAIDTFKAVFPNTTLGKLAAKSGKGQYKTLGDPAPIKRIMQYVSPVIYSQNSSNNYTNIIPLSGSGYISRYDNDDSNSVKFGKFTAMGSASINNGGGNQFTQFVDYYLDPSEAVTSVDGSVNPWVTGSLKAASYPSPYWGAAGNDLDNSQIVSLQTSFVTSFVSETNRVQDELAFELHMYTGSQDPTTEVAFNLEDIECKVYTEDGKVTNIGSVLDYGWFFMTNIVNYETVRKKRTRGILWWRRNRWEYTRVPVPTGGIKCTVDWEMYETLFDLGLMRERKPKGGAGVLALEWIITANSGAYTIKSGDEINWRIKGSFKNVRGGYRQGFFFPLGYGGAYTAVNIQGQGAYDHLLAEANTAQAPFWVFTGSAGGASTIHDPSILVMSSSNMNEAYGTTFHQGEVEYFPGPSDYFPGGVEPKTTNFDPIQYTIELKEGDEIRFANNENFTYRVIEVFAPSENVESGTARLKVKLDRPVDTSVNKDFFLVRRPIVNPNSLYLDTPFPYATLSSASISTGIVNTGSANFGLTGNIDENGNYTASFSDLEIASTPGILYPDFPTEYLVQSASIIVNDLISKGIIES